MKITHTIIRNNIARGIPEGTKVPEKPTLNLKSEEGMFQWHRYKLDLQALWDSSIEWEDHGEAWELMEPHLKPIRELFAKDRQVSESQIASYGVDVDFLKQECGIYPLEGVNAEKVWQRKTDNGWVPSVEKTHKLYQRNNLPLSREILRLIPQPNSEQRMKGPDDGEWVEGTEVSEPKKINDMNEFELIQAFKKNGGVSEGEPNQEELFQDFITDTDVYDENGEGDNIDPKKAAAKYYIQKLKP